MALCILNVGGPPVEGNIITLPFIYKVEIGGD